MNYSTEPSGTLQYIIPVSTFREIFSEIRITSPSGHKALHTQYYQIMYNRSQTFVQQRPIKPRKARRAPSIISTKSLRP